MLKGGWWWKSCGRGLNGVYLTNPNDLAARQGMNLFKVLFHLSLLNILMQLCFRDSLVPLARLGLFFETFQANDQTKEFC